MSARPGPLLSVDPSVSGGDFDDEWKDATRELGRQTTASQWRFVRSPITVDELADAPENVRELFADTFAPEALVDVTAEAEQFAAH